MCGEKTVETETLENGSFAVTRAKTVAKLARELAKVDLNDVKGAIEDADWDTLRDEEVDEECVLDGVDDAAQEVVGAIERLAAFLAEAAKQKLGVAIYTT